MAQATHEFHIRAMLERIAPRFNKENVSDTDVDLFVAGCAKLPLEAVRLAFAEIAGRVTHWGALTPAKVAQEARKLAKTMNLSAMQLVRCDDCDSTGVISALVAKDAASKRWPRPVLLDSLGSPAHGPLYWHSFPCGCANTPPFLRRARWPGWFLARVRDWFKQWRAGQLDTAGLIRESERVAAEQEKNQKTRPVLVPALRRD